MDLFKLLINIYNIVLTHEELEEIKVQDRVFMRTYGHENTYQYKDRVLGFTLFYIQKYYRGVFF